MPMASARPAASSSRASDDRREPSRGSSGTAITARSPRATSIAPLPSKLLARVSLHMIACRFAAKVQRLAG
jgi:hypothetical protein